MTIFTVEPYVGALPLRFGMTAKEVKRILGKPIALLPDPFGNRIEERLHLMLGYAGEDQRLFEAVFSPGAKVLFEGHDLFSEADVIGFLRQFDNSPFEWVGFIIFLRLGIRLSGFHDNDESQKAIGVVKKGYWDEFVEDFVPYK